MKVHRGWGCVRLRLWEVQGLVIDESVLPARTLQHTLTHKHIIQSLTHRL